MRKWKRFHKGRIELCPVLSCHKSIYLLSISLASGTLINKRVYVSVSKLPDVSPMLGLFAGMMMNRRVVCCFKIWLYLFLCFVQERTFRWVMWLRNMEVTHDKKK